MNFPGGESAAQDGEDRSTREWNKQPQEVPAVRATYPSCFAPWHLPAGFVARELEHIGAPVGLEAKGQHRLS